MRPGQTPPALSVAGRGGLLFEHYREAAGLAGAPAPHLHEEVQVGLNLNAGGQYRYRGLTHAIGPGELAVVPPGKVHQPGAGSPAPRGAEYLTLYVPLVRWRALGGGAGGPGFDAVAGSPVLAHPPLAQSFRRLHAAAWREAPALALDCLAEAALRRLARCLGEATPRAPRPAPRALDRVREHIRAHCAEGLRLADLAALAGLSQPHLCREFALAYGLPPHRYQVAARIARAKGLLLAGVPPADTAAQAGFADQAHLNRWFRRLVGVPPGAYHRQATRTFKTAPHPLPD